MNGKLAWVVFLVCLGKLVLADALSEKAAYWPLLANGYSTYHADAYRSDSTQIEPAEKYTFAGTRGPSNLAGVTANLDYDLGLNIFPIFASPGEPKIFAYYETGARTGQLSWTNDTAGIYVDNCATPWSTSIDADHNTFFSDCRYLYSTTSQGAFRWKSVLPRTGAQIVSFVEVFFTSSGDVGGVTNFGVVALYDRATGRPKLQFQLPNINGVDKLATGAVMNAPASMIDPLNPAVTRVFVVATLAQDPDANGVNDLGLYRVDISYNRLGMPSGKTAFVSVIPNGKQSATTPTISPSGKEVYIADDNESKLYAISTDSGKILWGGVFVGHQQGSVSTSRAANNLVFAGAGNRELAIVNPLSPTQPVFRGFAEMAQRYIPAKNGYRRDGVISTNILSTPTKLLFIVTLGYDTSTADEKGSIWPLRAFLVTTDHSGKTVAENEVPTTSDVTLSIQPDGTIFVPAADVQARLAAANLKENPERYSPYGTPMKVIGGIVVLKPTR